MHEPPAHRAGGERAARAERYFRGIYGADPSVVDDLAGDDIVISYPVFQSAIGTPAIRGREAVRDLVERFAGRWAEPRFTFHEAVCEGDRVVLLWSFQARSTADEAEHARGGITMLWFGGNGRIVAEIGEESEPGPMERVALP